MSKNSKIMVVSEITLYGSTQHGAGWLATYGGNMLGNGEPREGRTMTEAIWQACGALNANGITKGHVRVYEPRGRLCAVTPLQTPATFGGLVWEAAPQYTISVAEIEKAVETIRGQVLAEITI